ncbi:hypothetical protein [Streptomyces mirabilis]
MALNTTYRSRSARVPSFQRPFAAAYTSSSDRPGRHPADDFPYSSSGHVR